MEQKTIQIGSNTFRIKRMNAIEALALKSNVSLDTLDQRVDFFNTVLEKIEVKCNDQWYPVKKGDTFLPKGIEEDIETIEQLVTFFLNEYFKPLFQQSNKSN